MSGGDGSREREREREREGGREGEREREREMRVWDSRARLCSRGAVEAGTSRRASAVTWARPERKGSAERAPGTATSRVSLADSAVVARSKFAPSPEACPYVQGVRFMGSGSCAPGKVVTNGDLEELVETNDEWIRTRTGIIERRVLSDGEELADIAAAAATRALASSGVDPTELDLLILATSSADDLFGSSCSVQAAIGAPQAACFDLTSACSGFVVGLVTGAQYIRSGAYQKVLVIGGDALSRFVDWTDRNTCVLFGDGCGACVLGAQSASEGGCSLLSFHMESDGEGRKHLNASFSGAGDKTSACLGADGRGRHGSYSNLRMSGQDVFKWAVRAVPSVVQKAVEKSALESVDQIDWLVLHQANTRILDSAAARLGVPEERVIINISKFGNTSAGSVPLALDEAVRQGKIRSGDVVATAGFGAGLTAASAIFLWD